MQPAAKVKPQAKLKPQAKIAPPQPPRQPPPQPRQQAAAEDSAPAPPSRPPPLRQTVEAYFSDANLKVDRHLREVILESPGGWVDLEVVLELKRVRALRAKREETLRVLRDSSQLDLWHDPVDGSAAVRRAKGRPPPKLDAGAGAAPGAAAAPRPPPRRPAPTVVLEDAAPPDEEAAPAPATPEPEVVPDAEPGAVDVEEDAEQSAKRRRCVSAEVKPGARFVGKIASFHQGLGMGFISCRPTFEVFGRDLAVDRAAVKSFITGEYVAFGLYVDPDFGTPKAVDLEAGNEADMDYCIKEAPAPARKSVAKAKPAVALAAARGALAARRPQGAAKGQKAETGSLASMRFVGELVSWDEAASLGKISCPETFVILGRDVPVAEEECTGFDIGDRISFALRAAKAVELEAE